MVYSGTSLQQLKYRWRSSLDINMTPISTRGLTWEIQQKIREDHDYTTLGICGQLCVAHLFVFEIFACLCKFLFLSYDTPNHIFYDCGFTITSYARCHIFPPYHRKWSAKSHQEQYKWQLIVHFCNWRVFVKALTMKTLLILGLLAITLVAGKSFNTIYKYLIGL